MAKVQNGFDYDLFKMPDFSQLQADYSRMFSEFGKMFANGKMPSMDMDAVMVAQRKNIEAFQAANQVAFEGVQAVARRQAELVREASEDMQKLFKDLSAANVDERLAKQADAVKSMFETAVANTSELATMVQKTNNEAATVISKRVSENLDEVKNAFVPAKVAVDVKVKESAARK
ncbi:MAG: phasin family protein [Rhodospirillaceae bacterium]|nr:phasin family protein [Rhodospirillaceae bacterium]